MSDELNQYNDQIQQTSIKNWLQATADDAMGMEPGDRAMANEALKRIERLEADIKELEEQLDSLADSHGEKTDE